MNSNNPIDPKKGLDLSNRILIHLRQGGVDQQVITLLRTSCDKALVTEGVILSQVEKDRLIKEIALSILS
jgi:hypothetical protein